MEVYRIAKEAFAGKLMASGRAARWNLDDQLMLYTGSSRSLASLELIVRRQSISTTSSYKIMVISVAEDPQFYTEISSLHLPKDWRNINAYPKLQQLGSEWYRSNRSLILKVPSAIIPKEYNYLINANHPDFKNNVILKDIEDHFWDERLF